jgi:hypothetical protein
MKKINGHFLKGTVKRVCGALAAAAVLAVTPVIFDSCQNQTGTEQNGQKEYDANGWNINDPTDLINGTTGTQYDQAGYDRAGYNAAGYDKEGYNKAGYNQYGWNKAGENINGTTYDDNGFKMDGTYLETNSPYDSEGYNRDGYNSAGYNRDGYDQYGYDTAGYDKDGYDRDGYNTNGYDADGWNKDPNNLINEKTGTEYDENDIDRGGYDTDGWNTLDPNDLINKKTGTIYDLNGYDRSGQQKPEVEDIPAFGFDSSTTDVEYFERFGLTDQYSLALITTSELGTGQDANISLSTACMNLFPKWATQVQNLKDGYTTVADKYQGIDIFSKLADAEKQNLADIVFDGSNKDAILNAIFGDANSSEKSAFAADLAVFQKGNYFLQKQRFSSVAGSGSTEPTKADLTDDIKDLLDDPNFNTNGITQIAETTDGVVTNMSTILGQLEARMLNQLNTAMGVVGASPAITNENNQDLIKDLNTYLLKQIGEDRGQFDALFDDIDDLNTSNLNKATAKDYFSNNYHLTMESQKAGQLNSDFNFNLEFLKPGKEKDSGIQMA